MTKKISQRELEAKLKALNESNIEPTQENINHYEKCEYLTINTGRNRRAVSIRRN